MKKPSNSVSREQMRHTNRSLAAKKAWRTMRSAVYRAQRCARRSQIALKEWAEGNGYYCVFLDSRKGNPRTGIVDAILIKVLSSNADHLDVRLVQLKGGSAGLTAKERARLRASCKQAKISAAFAFWDDQAEELEIELNPLSYEKPE